MENWLATTIATVANGIEASIVVHNILLIPEMKATL